MVYTTVIQSYDYGVLVNIENKNFLVSNIHLKTLIPNQELVGQIIPVRVVNYKTDTYNRFYASHRSALNSDRNKKEKFNSIIENNSFIEKKPREYLLYALDDVVVGKVIKIFSDYALVDIGIEKYAYIHLREMSRWAKSPTEFLHLNLIREFIISDIYYNLGRSSLLGLSIKKLDEQIGDKRINQIYEEDENIIFYSQIAKRNHSNTGFTVSLEGTGLFLRDGFIEQNFVENKCLKYGTPLQIIEYRGYLQLSNRHALFTLRLKTIKIGDLITGKVRAIKEYGLFVDIGEGSVLLHISKISQAATNEIDLNSIFKVDDEIQAIVIQMDIEKGRVAVSTKELEIEPGDMLIDPRLVYQTSKEMADRYRRLVIERLDTFE